MTDTRTLVYVPLDDVQPATRNPKRHQMAQIRASIDRFGFVEPIIRDERTGRLLAGHGRIEELRRRHRELEPMPDGITEGDGGAWLVPVIHGWASVDDHEAEALLVALNAIPTLGGWDDGELATLLDELNRESTLDGIGFDEDDLNGLLDKLAGGPPLPSGDAGNTAEEGHPWGVIVVCADEPSQRELIDRFMAEGLTVRALAGN